MARLQPEVLLSELTRVEHHERNTPVANDRNRRQHIRHEIRGEAELQPVGRNRLSSVPLEVQLRDLARGGLGFVCSTPLPLDSSWRINFFCRGYVVGSQSLVVKRCTRIDDGLYSIGGQFVLDAGIMTAMGVDLAEIESEPHSEDEDRLEACFLPPTEID